MRQILTFLIASGALFAQTADAPKPLKGAYKYADELAKLTGKYRKEVEKKITAEQDAYDQQAQLLAAAHERGTFESLAIDREAKAVRLASELRDGRLSVHEFLFNELPKAAEEDFKQTRLVFEQESDQHLALLKTLADLSLDSKKMAILQSLFESLAKKPDLETWIKDTAAFATAFDKQMKRSDCALSVSRVAYYQGESARLQALIAKTSGDAKTALEAEKKVADNRVKELDAKRDATGAFDATKKTCTN